jgi:hypothetical protein
MIITCDTQELKSLHCGFSICSAEFMPMYYFCFIFYSVPFVFQSLMKGDDNRTQHNWI